MATFEPGPQGHQFGGGWTEKKLAILKRYLGAYATALKNQPFKKAYIDAFAGTGSRAPRRPLESGDEEKQLALALDEEEHHGFLDGSARIALRSEPGFDSYIFIERSAARCGELELLRQEFPERRDAIRIIQGDANQEIRGLCDRNWSGRRAVLFLDPYGMQVDWTTIEAIAQTRAIDLWVLFPLGMAVNRLLTRKPEQIDALGWRAPLDRMLGTTGWFDALYPVERTLTLFGEEEQRVKVDLEGIGRYYNDRLRSVFAGVAREPAVLCNSSQSPLYLLCFAVGNERGAKPALKIADHLLRGARDGARL